jgi:hypothetical protein
LSGSIFRPRQRALHLVRPHVRSDGVAVKAHFRGARKFTWAGYEVLVTIHGLDHMPLPEWNPGYADQHWLGKERNINEEQIGICGIGL